MLDSAGYAGRAGVAYHVSQLEPKNMTNRLLWPQAAVKLKDVKFRHRCLGGRGR